MLHIGNKDINLAVQGAGVLYVGSRKMGPIINENSEPTPGGTVLHQYDRVEGKATVAGFWTDGNGQRYAVCVADAAYRSGGKQWSNVKIDTPLPNYRDSSQVDQTEESGTWNTDNILNNYDASNYPAFNAARNACTVSVDNKTFESCLPNGAEFLLIWDVRATLDTYDTTLSEYPNNSLTTWNIGGNSNSRCWSSNEWDSAAAWAFTTYGYWRGIDMYDKMSNNYGVIPIIEIPVDENDRVITN